MKKKLFALSLAAALFTTSVNAQIQGRLPDKKVTVPANVPVRIFKVLSINFVVDSTVNHPGNQGKESFITETITYIGSGVANYTNYETTESANTRQYPNGIFSTTSTGSMTLNGGGADVKHFSKSSFHAVHTVKIVTNTPNQITSNIYGY